MLMLLIETATRVCSVAIAHDGNVVAQRCSTEANAHSSQLTMFIDSMLHELNLQPHQLDAVCVSEGPGSYTGLRIGVSTAKGLCFALEVPLFAVSTLMSMASLYYAKHPDYTGLVCPMVDARRMECYTMIVGRAEQESERDVVVLRETKAEVIESNTYDQWMNDNKMVFIGDGASKTKSLLGGNPNVIYDDGFVLSAEGMVSEGMRKWREGEKEDVAYFEPFYLKNFIAKKSVVHGLR
ncbi:MAG: tRNA (adenosine(37)-N6)-threonylcarbamoyltransferase complex dimerization subunit type 1 TsaB [Bacteroidales bacterium]|nr:tRNA (adenosine(37)-N6)-threonylcarbamoyltransferase complex dimerization subunit type 1 TsaB [Bacteroidales bacterium]